MYQGINTVNEHPFILKIWLKSEYLPPLIKLEFASYKFK